MQPKGYLRVTITGVDATGAATSVSSPPFYYADLSPVISSVTGQLTGVPTQGGTFFSLVAEYLDATSTWVNVSVGTTPPTAAPMIGPDGLPMSPFEVKAKVVAANPAGPWTINCTVPPGQGTGQGIMLVRDGSPSFVSAFIDYLPPTVSAWASCTPSTGGGPGGWSCGPEQLLGPGVVATAPTVGGRIRLIGSNFGVCPQVFAVSSFVYACTGPTNVPNPDVNRR
jgi:hypothetical protein